MPNVTRLQQFLVALRHEDFEGLLWLRALLTSADQAAVSDYIRHQALLLQRREDFQG